MRSSTVGPYKFIGLRGIDVTRPFKFIWFADMDAPKPYEFDRARRLQKVGGFAPPRNVPSQVPRTDGLSP